MNDVDLRHHGDVEAAAGLLDFATNVRLAGPPAWLRERLLAELDTLGRYPSTDAVRAAVAGRHGRPPEEALLTAGGAEAFVLVARALRPAHAVCVHPSFTEPEAALRAAGHAVDRVLLAPPFTLDPGLVPETADLVVLGNPTNPTSVLHPVATLEALARPGRILVVDEAFGDCVPGEPASVASRRDLPGLVVVRSLTKTWGLSGLRVGYVLAGAPAIARLAGAQPAWPVSSLAIAAAEACTAPDALAEAAAWAQDLSGWRSALAAALAVVPGVEVVPDAAASFLLLRVPGGEEVRRALRAHGVAVRRGDTFPGLGPDWIRVAVREPALNARLVEALGAAIGPLGPAREPARPGAGQLSRRPAAGPGRRGAP